jgi:LTXXQ motif family protein
MITPSFDMQETLMNTHRRLIARSLAAAAIAIPLIALCAPALSQTPPTSTPDMAAKAERMQEHIQARLDRMAERLEIKASQQDAWNAYATVVRSLVGTPSNRPGPDADAATIVRFRAERMTEFAQKLGQVADATAKLQQALTPEQRKVLTEIARHGGPLGGHHGHRGEHWDTH